MKFYFHPAANAEFDLAVEYYEGCQSGLGFEFAEEVYATIARIIEYPEVWSPMSRNTRRSVPDKSFPVRDYLSDKKQQPAHHRCCRSTQATRLLDRKKCAKTSCRERREVAHPSLLFASYPLR
jgi:hypothetical protein